MPIFKKGSRSAAGDNCDVLTDVQHGFRKRRLCETQLIMTIDDLAKSVNKKCQTDVSVRPFKGFDQVPHGPTPAFSAQNFSFTH